VLIPVWGFFPFSYLIGVIEGLNLLLQVSHLILFLLELEYKVFDDASGLPRHVVVLRVGYIYP
jgi:hypothetical protein